MRKFQPGDHCQHLAELLAQLYRLEALVQAGDGEAALRLATSMDWHCVADEFEAVVARHCYGVEQYARRVSHNLLRPYVQYHDCLRLAYHMRMLEGVLADSPSLHADADSEVAVIWQRQLERAGFRRRPIRDMPPVTTLSGLRAAVAAKIALGQALERSHAGFDAGERVSYADLLDYLPMSS